VPIAAAQIPAILVERIESYHPSPALFCGDDVGEWPPGVLPHLLDARLLTLAGTRVEAVVCPGCEWSCQKELVVRSRGSQRQAYVICDEPPDLGRIAIAAIVPYQTTLRALAVFVGARLTASTPRPSHMGSSFGLGTLKGRYGPREVALVLHDRRLILRVGGHEAALLDILRWEGEALTLDQGHVRRLAARKGQQDDQSTPRAYRPDRSGQRLRSRRIEARNRRIAEEAQRLRKAGAGTWTAISNRIAGTSLAQDEQGRRISAATIRRIISGSLAR
jgi:hypothetical protein